MKRIVVMICGWWTVVSTFAQQAEKVLVPLSMVKTTSLVFPSAVRYVDVGTKDILVQKVEAAENLLLVKAAKADFTATNLTVVTADGRLYCIDAVFRDNPDVTVHYMSSAIPEVSFAGALMALAELQQFAIGIADNPRWMRGTGNNKWGVRLRVNGIYVKGKVLFFHCVLDNFSPIDYEIDFIRFYLWDRKRGKRTAVQEIELQPVYKAGDLINVKANCRNSFVVAMEKFTIPDAKDFVVQVGEKNGGRQLRLRLGNRKIMRAKMLPSIK